MLYFIGGAPRLGKSVIARELMKEISVPWLSTDTLRDVFYELADEKIKDELYPNAGENDLEKAFNIPVEESLAKQLKEAESMKIGLHKFLENQVISKNDFILEGVCVTPTLVHEFFLKHNSKFKSVFIVDFDETNYLQALSANEEPFDWTAEHPTLHRKIANFSIEFSKIISTDAEKNGFPVYHRTNDFYKDVRKTIELLKS